MRHGYARVSLAGPTLQTQRAALHEAGVENLYVDHSDGTASHRPQFDALLDTTRAGDTLVVFRLDRIGRSLHHLTTLLEHLNDSRITLVSLRDQLDTSTLPTPVLRTVLAALHGLTPPDRVPTPSGQGPIRRPRAGGRPPALTPHTAHQATNLHHQGLSVGEIASAVGVSKATIYRHIARHTR